MNSSSTTTTMTIAWIRLSMKPLIAFVTESDWRAITVVSMPIGRSGSSSTIRRSMASPMTTTLPPCTVEMASPIAG